MTYWKQFAEMLGLELERQFVLTDSDGERKDEYTYKIAENGLRFKGEISGQWCLEPSETIERIIDGTYKTVPMPWKPKYGDKSNQACCSLYYVEDYAIWKSGNCFKTKEEAETKGKEIMEKLVKEYEES